MRPILTRAILGVCALGIVALIAFYVYLHSQKKKGEELWEAALAKFEADGESLDPAFRFALPIPDEANAAAIPLLRNVTARSPQGETVRAALDDLDLDLDREAWPKLKSERNTYTPWRALDLENLQQHLSGSKVIEIPSATDDVATGLLQAIEGRNGAQIRQMHEAAARHGQAQFIPSLTEVFPPGPPLAVETTDHLQPVLSLARSLKLHAGLSLHAQKPEDALAGIRSLCRLGTASGADCKTVITYLVGQGIYQQAFQIVWEGLLQRSFSADQLAEIERELLDLDPLGSLTDAYRGELVAMLQTLDALEEDPAQFGDDPEQPTRMPLFVKAWFNHNRAAILNHFHQTILAPSKSATPYLEMRKQAKRSLEQAEEMAGDKRYLFANMALPSTASLVKRAALAHVHRNQAMIACALERYFIANRQYPESLELLRPELRPELLLDPIDQRPMRYGRTSDGRYQLHSVGWDGSDEGGAATDIVWGYESP